MQKVTVVKCRRCSITTSNDLEYYTTSTRTYIYHSYYPRSHSLLSKISSKMMSLTALPSLIIVAITLAPTSVLAATCELLFDGRVPQNYTAADFDKPTSIYDHEFVHGTSWATFWGHYEDLLISIPPQIRPGLRLSNFQTSMDQWYYTTSPLHYSLLNHPTQFDIAVGAKPVEVTLR